MANTKPLTLRLSQQLAEDLATVAKVDGQPMAETIRTAITTYLWRRTNEPGWEAERDAALNPMKRLAEEPSR